MIKQAALLILLAAIAALQLFGFGIIEKHHILFTLLVVLFVLAISAAISSYQNKMLDQEDPSQ